MNIDRRVLSRIFRRRPVVFDCLGVINDNSFRNAAMNMAIDEALLESATIPSIRFYRWNSPALSFGYFGKFAEVANYATQCDLVRRWTGGGVVFHGEDLTYSIIIPASNPVFDESPTSIYEKIHAALRNALVALGQRASVAADPGQSRNTAGTTAISARSGECFANPVHADVMVSGRKVAGAAQRRTRTGLLQQGSIQLAKGRVRASRGFDTGHVGLPISFERRFARELSSNCPEQAINNKILSRARDIAMRKYGTEEWLRRR